MNAMLSEQELAGLLAEAADDFPVPELVLDRPAPAGPAWWQRRRWQASAAAAALVAGTVLLQGAVGGGPAGGSSAALSRAAAVPSVGVPGTGKVPAAAGASATLPEPDAARVVKTGSITLSVDSGKVSATVSRVQALVSGLGGYVSDSSTQEAGDHPSATVTVRVPVARFDPLVAQVRALPVTVVSAQTSGEDVTADYTDLQAQIQSLTAARSRYLAILAGARTIGETLTVQQRVDDVQRQIDQLEGQRRVLADQSDLGTLTVTVGENADQVLVAPARSGWSKAWHDATHGFTSGLQGLLAASGTALLVLLLGAVVVVLARLGWRRARRRLV